MFLFVYDPSAESLIDTAVKLLGQPCVVNIMDYVDAGKILVLSSTQTSLRVIAVLPDLAAHMIVSELSNRSVPVTSLPKESQETVFLAAWMATYGPLGEIVSGLLAR